MKITDINVKTIVNEMQRQYNFLYNSCGRIDRYWESVNKFDLLMESDPVFKNLVTKVVNERMDIISSDREVAAFMFALEEVTHTTLF